MRVKLDRLFGPKSDQRFLNEVKNWLQQTIPNIQHVELVMLRKGRLAYNSIPLVVAFVLFSSKCLLLRRCFYSVLFAL